MSRIVTRWRWGGPPNGRAWVYLESKEVLDLLKNADERQSSKDARGILGEDWTGEGGAVAHRRGLLGEYAVCEFTGGIMDLTQRLNGDKGRPDIRLPDGTTMEVKTRGQPYWEFLLNKETDDHIKATYGGLAWLRQGCASEAFPVVVEIVGWIAAEDFAIENSMYNFNHGWKHGVAWQLMRDSWLPCGGGYVPGRRP